MKRSGFTFALKLIAVSLLIVLLTGVVAYATDPGSSSDPVVTLSYLERVFGPSLLSQLESSVKSEADSLASRFDKNIADFKASLKGAVANSAWPDPETEYVSVSLQEGQSLSIGAGSQLLFISGGAEVTEGELSDVTQAQSATAGQLLSEHHLYMAADDTVVSATTQVELLVKEN